MSEQVREARGFFSTWVDATFRPARLFADPPASRSRWSPLLFALTVGAASAFGGVFLEVLVKTASLAKAAKNGMLLLVVSSTKRGTGRSCRAMAGGRRSAIIPTRRSSIGELRPAPARR